MAAPCPKLMFSSWPVSAFVEGVNSAFDQAVAVDQTRRQVNAAHLAVALIVLPTAAGQIAARDALHRQHAGAPAQHDAPGELCSLGRGQAGHIGWIGRDQVMVDDAGEVVEPELRYLGKHYALAGWPVGQHHVESADPIGGDDQQRLLAVGLFDVVEIADLAAAFVGQTQIGLHDQSGQGFPPLRWGS